MMYCSSYYAGYKLSDEYIELNEENRRILCAAVWMVDNRSTIRETALNCDFSKSALHRRIHKDLRRLSPELYKCVCRQMNENRRKKK